MPAARSTASLAGDAEARTTRTRQTLRAVGPGRSISAMVRLLVLYNPPEDAVAFDKYYNEIHIPLAKQLPGLVRYTISRNLAANAQYYLIAELDWADMASAQAALRSPIGADVRRRRGQVRDHRRVHPAVRGRRGLMRFGLVGTGHWARITHAPALASTPGVSLAAVWGRDAGAAAALAAEHGATAFSGLRRVPRRVDAVAFAVPPHVQAPLAIRAAEAGQAPAAREAGRAVRVRRRQAGRRGRGGRRRLGRVLHLAVQHRDPRLAHRRAGPRRLVGRAGPAASRSGSAPRCSRTTRSTRRGGRRRAPSGTSARTWSACSGPASAR